MYDHTFIFRDIKSECPQSAPRARKLKAPYIKVEDSSLEFRPLTSKFTTFPLIQIDKIKDPPQCQANIQPAPRINFSEDKENCKNGETQNPLNHKCKGQAEVKGKSPKSNEGQRGNCGCKKDSCTKCKTHKRASETKKSREKLKQNHKGPTKRVIPPHPKSGYCEMCDVYYQDLKTHTQSEVHLKFISKGENFASLDEIISGLPTLPQLLSSLQTATGSHSSPSQMLGACDNVSENCSKNLNPPKESESKCLELIFPVKAEEQCKLVSDSKAKDSQDASSDITRVNNSSQKQNETNNPGHQNDLINCDRLKNEQLNTKDVGSSRDDNTREIKENSAKISLPSIPGQ